MILYEIEYQCIGCDRQCIVKYKTNNNTSTPKICIFGKNITNLIGNDSINFEVKQVRYKSEDSIYG